MGRPVAVWDPEEGLSAVDFGAGRSAVFGFSATPWRWQWATRNIYLREGAWVRLDRSTGGFQAFEKVDLPGGAVRAAVGGEYIKYSMREEVTRERGTGPASSNSQTTFIDLGRDGVGTGETRGRWIIESSHSFIDNRRARSGIRADT